ncbi:sugar phosphate isomerase/epimerase family protein [Thalassotalea agariperforans]
MKSIGKFNIVFAGVILLVSTFLSAEPSTLKVPPVSVQLHSVKLDIANDFEGTLKAIANMGFQGVEFAGRYGPYANDPQGLKNFLNSLGLKASGAHIPTKNLLGENGNKTFKFLKALGAHLVIIPHDKRIDDPEKIADFVAEITEISRTAKRFGMLVGYHNHAKEFNSFADATFWDYLASNTPKDVVLQLDVGWANYADQNPVNYVKQYPNRTVTTHYKIRTKKGEHSKPVIIGQDSFDWAELIKANIEHGGTEWIVIEQEEYPDGMTPLQAVKASKQGLDNIIKQLTLNK